MARQEGTISDYVSQYTTTYGIAVATSSRGVVGLDLNHFFGRLAKEQSSAASFGLLHIQATGKTDAPRYR